ncbi:MAG TPA: hypothetical protein VI168_04040 [Croceibacterium sp.]
MRSQNNDSPRHAPAAPSPYQTEQRTGRPIRVLLLALAAVAGILAGADLLSGALWSLSDQRYADEVLDIPFSRAGPR